MIKWMWRNILMYIVEEFKNGGSDTVRIQFILLSHIVEH